MASATGVSVVQEGVLLKQGRVGRKHRYVKLVADLASHVTGPMLSSELLIYSNQKQDKLKKRMRIEEMVNIHALGNCAFNILLNDGKTLQFKAETNEAYLCWVSNLKAALGRGEVFHAQLFSSVGVEHALMYSMEVALPTHRLGQIDRLLVLTSPVHEVNLYAWDLNRVLTFTKSDIGIRMELCRTCAGSKDAVMTFLVCRPYLNNCMEFLCREAKIVRNPTDENGAWVYRTDHTCGISNAPPTPAPIPPGASKVTSFLAQYVNREAFEGPYSVSKKLIITDCGTVKFESKIFGSIICRKPKPKVRKTGVLVPSSIKPDPTPTSGLGDVEIKPLSSSLQQPPPFNQSSKHAPEKSPPISIQPPPLPAKKKSIASRSFQAAVVADHVDGAWDRAREEVKLGSFDKSRSESDLLRIAEHELLHPSHPGTFCASKTEVFVPDTLASRSEVPTVSKPEVAVPKLETFFTTFEAEASISTNTSTISKPVHLATSKPAVLDAGILATSKPVPDVRICKPIPKPRPNIKHKASNQSMCSVSVLVTNTMETVNEEVRDVDIYI